VTIADIITAVLGVVAILISLREFWLAPMQARQAILNSLPASSDRALADMNYEQQVAYVEKKSLSFGQLNAQHAFPRRHLKKALYRLVKEHRIEIFILKGIAAEGGPPPIPAGTKLMIPHVYKGLLPPGLRSPDQEVALALRAF
jgi:hypothetical protein